MGKAAVCLIGALLLAAPALAAPVTYNFTSAQVTVTATTADSGTIILSSTLIAMDGVYVTFDENTIELTDFFLTIPTTGIIDLDTAYGGYDQFRIESADLSPGGGYATLFGAPAGPGQYTFVAGPIDINGVYSAFDSTNVNPDINNAGVPFTDTSLINGSININTGTLELSEITLTSLPGAFFGESEDLDIKADIMFIGVVPEPATALLVGLGLVGLACARRINFLK